QFKEEIQVQSDQAQREARKGEELKKELSQAKSDLENRTAELKTKAGNLQRAQEDITKLDQELKEQRIVNENAMEYTDVLNARLNKVQQDFDQQLVSINRLATENEEKAAELKAKEDEINGLRQERLHQRAMAEAIQRKLRAIEDLKIEVEQREETLKGQVSDLKKDLESTRKQAEADKKAIDDLVCARDILNKEEMEAKEKMKIEFEKLERNFAIYRLEVKYL
ncbi:unnamed protein product, partial [Pocillopora meandrina]